MKIERALELLKEFEDGVSHNPGNGLNSVLEYQDIIGTSSINEIQDFESTLKKGQEKKHFQWVNFLTLSEDMAMDILKGTVLHRWKQSIANEYEEYISERENSVCEKEFRLNDCKKAIWKRIKHLRADNIDLTRKIDYWRERALVAEQSLNKCQHYSHVIQDKAEKYDNIKSLLTD